jgi:phage repressor protein C with HTH and peptisase S24 domain
VHPASVGAEAHMTGGFVFVPRLAVEASAGHGREVVPIHQYDQTVAFQESWLHKIGVSPKNAHALSAVGDSMEPTIRDGDLLLVDTSIDKVRDNGIYVIVVDGMVLVKRLHVRTDRSLVLKSDNPQYPAETIQAADTADLHVAGRVRWFGRAI